MNIAKQLYVTAIVAGSALLSFSASAEKIILNLGDAHYRGGTTLPLKQMIKQKHRRFNLRRSNIISVKVVAKSKHGGGTASLYINGRENDRQRIGGHRSEFHNPAKYTFDRILLNPLRRRTPGAWQLRLDGNIKVKRIVIQVDRTFRPAPLHYIEVGTKKAPKVIDEVDTFRIGQGPIQKLVIKGESNKVQVKRVVAELRNGRTIPFPSLTGTLRGGDTLVAHVGGKNIHKIWVTVTSPSLIGGRGKYKVEVGVFR